MRSNLEIITALIFLIGYSYTLSAAHIILAKVDKVTAVPRQKNGEIKIAALAGLSLVDPNTRRAVRLLRANNYIVYIFFALLIFSLVIQ